MQSIDVEAANERFAEADPGAVLRWAWDAFGASAAATSSFQTQSVPLLHLISTCAPRLPVLFLDTGFHFSETLAFRDALAEQFGLRVRVLENRLGHQGFQEEYGELHRHDPDLCCFMNKVEPLQDALEGYQAWIAGIRRDQTPARAGTPVVSLQENGVYKICPLAAWTGKQVWQYMDAHALPRHPLLEKGYLSIGCAPCTRPVEPDQGARAGRWDGQVKTECGLHLGGSEASSS